MNDKLEVMKLLFFVRFNQKFSGIFPQTFGIEVNYRTSNSTPRFFATIFTVRTGALASKLYKIGVGAIMLTSKCWINRWLYQIDYASTIGMIADSSQTTVYILVWCD